MDCAAPRHEQRPEPADGHSWLCLPCRRRLSRHLRRLPALYAELDLVPRRSGPSRGRGDGLPFNDPVSEIRSQVVHDLAWWCLNWAEDRRWMPPERNVAAMAGWLHGSIRLMIFRDWAGDLAGAMAADYGRALMILDPYRAVRIARRTLLCPCGGQLLFTVYSDDDKRTSLAECRSCGGEWEPVEWMTLGRKMRAMAS